MLSPSRCKIDYVSISFAPTLLRRLTELAKMRAVLKSPLNAIDWRVEARQLAAYLEPLLQPDEFVLDGSLAQLHNAGFILNSEIDEEDFDNPALSAEENASRRRASTFHGCFADWIASFGVQWLDALCQAEIEFFLHVLNEKVSPQFLRWTFSPKAGGMFGYKNSGTLLCDGMPAGVVAWGAANHGCLISFSGAGCAALDFKQLHQMLAPLGQSVAAPLGNSNFRAATFGAKITRLDIALDDYSGELFTPYSMREAACDGAFVGNGKPPVYRWCESGCMLPSKDAKAVGRKFTLEPSGGVTFYVGSRESGKLFRCYEKGKQMKSEENPNWVRAEMELHSHQRKIDFDALINPDPYFAGCYEILAEIMVDVPPITIPTFKNDYTILASVAIENGKRQIGRLINFMFHYMGMSSDDIVKQLTADVETEDIPHRLEKPLPQDLFDEAITMNLGPIG
jgi:phage replication initiation protein